jgi:hypothetical protein
MIFQSDAIIKESINLMIEDMRANQWLLDDIFSNFVTNPYLKKKYATQIQNSKDWFKNNKIFIEMGQIDDRTELPRISIILGSQTQARDMDTMGDASTESVILLPAQINKPIPFIVKAFTPVSYDAASGTVEVPVNLKCFNKVVSGQILVNVSTGKAFSIDEVLDDTTLLIDADSNIGTGQLAIVPKYAYYEAKVEHIWMNVNYKIVCTGLGDAQVAIWLHDIVLYGLMRYKAGLLEALGLSEASFDSDALGVNPNLSDAGQVAWERTISIKGKVEQTFIKAPHRLLESVDMRDTNPNNACPAPSEDAWLGGIKIASISEPDTIAEEAKELWYPINDGKP